MTSLMQNRFICPALAILASVIALVGAWFTRSAPLSGRTQSSTLLEVLRGDSFVEYNSMRWVWISGVGVLLVVLSALVGDVNRKKLAEAGSYIMVTLPVWSLFNIFTGDDDFGAGWALYASAAITVAVIILARFIPEEQPANLQAQSDQPLVG